jgi:hypothetical protein
LKISKTKIIFWVIVASLMVAEYSMYRHEHQLRLKEENNTRELVQQYRALQEKDQMMSQSLDEIAHHQQSVEAEGVMMDQRKYYRINWKNYIHVSLNNYSTGLFGGVRNIRVIVNNSTDYLLDNVMVDVQYLKSDGSVFKTETVNINSIQPDSTISVPAPESRRGMSAKIQIRRITSQTLNFCWTFEKGKLPDQMDSCRCAVSNGG